MKYLRTMLVGAMLAATMITVAKADDILVSPDGKYLGKLGGSRYDADSTSNPYGKYGSRYSSDSINNPYGEYGSKYSNKSPNNPYATQQPRIINRY